MPVMGVMSVPVLMVDRLVLMFVFLFGAVSVSGHPQYNQPAPKPQTNGVFPSQNTFGPIVAGGW